MSNNNAKLITFFSFVMRRGISADDVFIAITLYAIVRTQVWNQVANSIQNGDISMIDVSTFGPPSEYLMAIVFITALFAGLTAYIVTAIRKGDFDKKNGTVSNWDLKYVLGSVFAAIMGGAMAILATPMIFDGLGVEGASCSFFAIVTGIVSIIFTRWWVIGIHEGPLEVIKDFKAMAALAKKAKDAVKTETKPPAQ